MLKYKKFSYKVVYLERKRKNKIQSPNYSHPHFSVFQELWKIFEKKKKKPKDMVSMTYLKKKKYPYSDRNYFFQNNHIDD